MPDVYNFNKQPVIRQWPFPLAEAADIVLAHMDTETKAAVIMTSRDNLKIFHATIGQWIMDTFGMRQTCGGLDADQEWIPILGAVWDRLYTGDSD
jgi:uncharacterized protein YdiU (UPF0061 family)